jgi:oxygen-dependent protoporphyrinogen oxidase
LPIFRHLCLFLDIYRFSLLSLFISHLKKDEIMSLDAIILGAGPAGLAVAHELNKSGAKVKVVESSQRVGGSIRTINQAGWVVETGPNTLQINGEGDLKILRGYGLDQEILRADSSAANRFILSRGKLHALTAQPTSLLKSDLLSFTEKVRLLSEIFIPRSHLKNESVFNFISRRFGSAAAELLMDPVIAGTHAGNPRALMIESCFPLLTELEKNHRSVLLGLIKNKKEARAIIGFKNGMQQLAESIAESLKNNIELGCHVTLMQKSKGGWQVAWRNTRGEEMGAWAKNLIITLPHWQWSATLPFEILKDLEDWKSAPSPSVTVMARGYNQSDVPHSLNGFGYLIPQSEKREILGTLFSSSVLPSRAPDGKILLTSFIGGARQPQMATKSDIALGEILDRELSETLGITARPEREWIQRWEKSIPQYTQGQTEREHSLALCESKNASLYFHGAFRGGISLMQVIGGGHALAQKISKS